MIDAGQVRAARALLNISQTDLAKIASVHVATVRRIEAATELRGAVETLWKIQTALEKAGIQFIPADESAGPGVRLGRVRTRSGEKARARRKT
jgi:transcriptional regulator with XRE-family HTH domain